MSNKNYLFNGSQLFKVIRAYKNQIEVQATTERLTKHIARNTYATNQLETLGYIIFEGRRCDF